MKKKKQQNNIAKNKEVEKTTLLDALDSSMLEKLKHMKSALKEDEIKREEEELRQKAEERKQREKNKTFEELFNESSLDWKKFK